MSAPAGRALAGYFDPHAHAVPMSFNCISPQGQGTLDKFLDYLFPNDVNCLKPDGKLRELILSCGACLIGWYKHFKADYGNEHPIVKKIQHAAKYANISDSTISQPTNVPVWLATLNLWSNRIYDKFVADNPERVDENGTLIQQYQGLSSQLGSMLSKVGDLETKVSNFERSLTNLQNLIEANCMLTNAIKNARDREVRLEAELKKSKRKIDEVMKTVAMTSPAGASVIGAGAGTPRSTTDADGNAALDMDGEVSAENEGKTAEEDLDDALLPEDEVQEPPSQRQRVVNAFKILDELPTAPLIDPNDLSIGRELERLCREEKNG